MGSRRTIMRSGVAGLLLLAFVLCPPQLVGGQRSHVSCYDARGAAQRCIPPFMNAAYDVVVEATNTCGLTRPQSFCLQTGVTGATKSCDRCDAKDPQRMHPSRYLTDFNNNDHRTWWQSETMADGNVQYPHVVNLTLHLGKSFDITYVRLKFYSSRPESFMILKRTSESHPWDVYQMYSASCEETYSVPEREIITRDDEQKAVCTDEFSDISPLSGASVVFSTLEGRPSAYEFETSLELQEWVTATDIRIALTRMNTFRDEVFGDPSVLSSYFYAISDFSVGGRCKCNGHASECVKSTGQGLEERMVCRCEHQTNGPDCSECLPFYNDRPWHRATATDAHECIACDCNGLSSRCYFDEQLFRDTGHGGHCMDCRDNTAGPHCDRCKDNYFRQSPDDRCEPCQCNPTGSETGQCDDNGRCECKPGVTGPKCDRCLPNHYDFGPQGCKQCACEVAGSRDNSPLCSSDTGVCVCKETVEGTNCDRCKPGFFNMEEENSAGCMACFCHGHASTCDSASGYGKELIQSDFSRSQQMWTAEDQNGRAVLLDYSGVAQALGVSSSSDAPVYFVAPARYLDNQRLSYGQYLTFKLRVGQEGARASAEDVIIEGDGLRVTAPIYGQGNEVPRTVNQEYRFRLYDAASLQWTPKLSAAQFQRMLGNLTAVKIRGSYTNRGIGYIDDVWLESAVQGAGGEQVTYVEQCQCPPEYVGQFCESCAAGYHREPAGGGAMARCVPCRCNGHSDTCEMNTGRCICEDNTTGDNCEKCVPGYYGNALQGTPGDCKTCPCPEGGECVELVDGEVACINCKEGYTGNRCEVCADGYWGDPEGRYGPRRPCTKCICSDNIDPNAVGNCNSRTGECLKCVYNTTGWNCDKCLTGYYGSAQEHKCSPCECHANGSTLGSSSANQLIPCDQKTGQCQCHFRVTGRRCDQCDVGYWNIDSKRGCEQCLCDVTGSYNSSCDITTGQCQCKPGVGSRRCDNCAKGNYGFAGDGCKACQCNATGSIHEQCDLFSGQCPCKTNVVGLQCQQCAENKFNMSAGCVDCPACYNLVQDRVSIFRKNLHELKLLIANIGDHPQAINDADFVRRIREVNASVTDLLEDARRAGGGSSDGGALAEQLEYIRQAIVDVTIQSGKIAGELSDAQQSSTNSIIDVTEAERLIVEAELHLREIEALINTEGRNALDEAASKAGQQSERMTEIARLAREEVERQEADAKRIEETAAKALDTSREALRIAQEALQKPKDVSEDLTDLRRQLINMEQLYQQTKSMADQALTLAQKTYTQSLTIYTESESLTINRVDTAGLKNEAADVKAEAARIKLEATNLIEQHRQLMEDVNKERREAEKLLEEGIEQQQITDGLLADADAARDIARQAIAQSEKILRDAQESLKTLQEFDKKVQESKKKAADALKKVPEIEASIEEAEEKTRRALDDLADAEENARLAREIAELAQGVADMASEDAGKLKMEADALRKRATELKVQADGLAEEVDDILKKLEALERQAREDETVIKDALEKAGQAKTDATSTSEKVTAAMATVKEISDILASLEEIDVDKLDQLEQSLNAAERRLVEADIEQRYQDLVSAQQLQRQWVQTYAADLIQLHRDVDNVRLINATIPRTCYSNIELEKDVASAFTG